MFHLFSFLGAILTFHLLDIKTMPRTKPNLELQQALQLYNNTIVTNPAFVNGFPIPLIFSPIGTPNFGINQIIPTIGPNVQSPPHHLNHSIEGIGLSLPRSPHHHNNLSHTNEPENVRIPLNSNFTDISSSHNVGIENPTLLNNVGLCASPISQKTTNAIVAEDNYPPVDLSPIDNNIIAINNNVVTTPPPPQDVDNAHINTAQAVNRPNPMVQFHENSVINSIIEKTINYGTLTRDIVILKQYLSPTFDPDFQVPGETLEEATNRCFVPGMFFKNIPHLKKTINMFGEIWGFRGSVYGTMICCSRADTPQRKEAKKDTKAQKALASFQKSYSAEKRRSSSYQCGCLWRIYCSYINKSLCDFVKITKVYSKHTNTCEPCANQLMISKTKARDYAIDSRSAMREIMRLIDINPHVRTDVLLPVVKEAIPGRKKVTKKDVSNLRIRARMLLNQIKKSGNTLDNYDFQGHNVTKLTKSLDNITSDIIDEAVASVKEVYQQYLNDDSCSTKLFGMLEKLGKKDSGFTYNIAFDSNNKATGVVWMTSTMRSNLYRFGSFICVDAMKRNTNVYEWPYIGPTVLNDLNHIAVVCEAFCIAERLEAYQFVLKSMLQMAPNFDPNSIKVIFADEFLTQETITDAGLTNTRLVYDHYHLLDNVNKSIGPIYNEKYSRIFKDILNADTEYKFNVLVQQGREFCKDNSKAMKEINDIVDIKDQCIAYAIDSIPGSYGKRGSAHAEQNHSSIISIIGDYFTGELEDLLSILLERQKEKNKQFNTELAISFSDMLLIHQELQSSHAHPILIEASKNLSKISYNRFLKAYKESFKYTSNMLDDSTYVVHRSTDQTAPFRKFKTKEDRCNCKNAIAFQEQCTHEIKLLMCFDLKRFGLRHHKRKKLTMATYTNGYTNPHCYQHLIIDRYTTSRDEYEEDDMSPFMRQNIDTQINNHVVNNPCNDNQTIIPNQNVYDVNCHIDTKSRLSIKDAQGIVSRLYNACSKQPHLHVIVGGFLLQMVDAIEKKEVSTLTTYSQINQHFSSLIHNFNSSFNTIDSIKPSQQIELQFCDPKSNPYNTPRKRLKSVMEKSKKKQSLIIFLLQKLVPLQ